MGLAKVNQQLGGGAPQQPAPQATNEAQARAAFVNGQLALARAADELVEIEEKIKTLKADRQKKAAETMPLMKFAADGKSFTTEKGVTVLVKKPEGRSATKTLIVKRWGKEGEEFWENIPKSNGDPYLSVVFPKGDGAPEPEPEVF